MTEIELGSEAERIQNSDYWKRIRDRMKDKVWDLLSEAAEKNLDPTPLAYMVNGFVQIEALMKNDIDAKELALAMLKQRERKTS